MNEPRNHKAWIGRLEQSIRFLPDKPEETATSTLHALWLAAAGQPASAERAIQMDLPMLTDQQYAELELLVQRRIEGIPLAHLTGRQQFMSAELLAGPEALIPRKETEILARCVIDLLERSEEQVDAPTVIDTCTGAGNLPISFALHSQKACIFAADLCPNAVGLARRNVKHMNLACRVDIQSGDLLAPFDNEKFHGKVDILSCNPPYISTGKVQTMELEIAAYEPKLAFDGGLFGISILQRLIQEAPRFLKSGGWLVFEVGVGQGRVMAKRLSGYNDFNHVETHEDKNGDIRVIAAQRS